MSTFYCRGTCSACAGTGEEYDQDWTGDPCPHCCGTGECYCGERD